jgi:hypothetical protein
MKLKLRMFGGKITRVSINICTTVENKRGEAWTHEETVLLIELWGWPASTGTVGEHAQEKPGKF